MALKMGGAFRACEHTVLSGGVNARRSGVWTVGVM